MVDQGWVLRKWMEWKAWNEVLLIFFAFVIQFGYSVELEMSTANYWVIVSHVTAQQKPHFSWGSKEFTSVLSTSLVQFVWNSVTTSEYNVVSFMKIGTAKVVLFLQVNELHLHVYCYPSGSWFQTLPMLWMLYSFFWVIPRHLNFMCWHFRTLSLLHLHRLCEQE